MFKKYKKLNLQAKAAFWFLICSLLQKSISVITVPVFTRLMTTEDYGTYSLYLSWYQIMTIFTSLYLYFGVFNNALSKYENDRDRYISSMQGLTLIITFAWFVLFLIVPSKWKEIFGLSIQYILLMFLELTVNPAISFWSGKQRFEYKYKKLVFLSLAISVINPILGIFLVVNFSNPALARVTSIVIVEAIVYGSLMILQFIKGKCFYDKKYWKYALKLAIPLLPHYLSGMILNQGDRIMIDKIVGSSAVAIYSIAYNIGMLVQLVTNAISNSLSPWMYEKMKASDSEAIRKMVNAILFISGAVAVCLMLISPEVVWIFGDTEYAEASYVILPIAASTFFIFCYNLVSFPQFYFEKTKFLAASSVIAAILNIILNYIFITLFGYIAAGYTTLVCYMLYALGHYLVSKKVYKSLKEKWNLYDGKIIVVEAVILVLFCVVCNFLIPHLIIRYSTIIIMAFIALLKRKKLFSIIKPLI